MRDLRKMLVQLCEIFTDFKFFFTDTLSRKFLNAVINNPTMPLICSYNSL